MKRTLTVLVLALTGCAGSSHDDEALYLTGTEEQALAQADGSYHCASPKKVLICHIPPGNPANRHTICVGAAAVKAHRNNHGDPVGPCGPPAPADAGSGGGSGSDAGSTCKAANDSCQQSSECCAGFICSGGVCTPNIL